MSTEPNQDAQSAQPADVRGRLEYLRGELRNESMSYGELAELYDLAQFIDPDDVELLEAAGVPEFPNDPLPIHRVTIYVRDQEPRFEDYTNNDEVISVSIEANVGEYDSDKGEMTVFEESTP